MCDKVEFYYFMVVAGVFLCSCSQLMLKKSAVKTHKNILYSMLNWRVFLAYLISFGSLFINILAMSKGVNVKDMPILESSGYIFVPLLSFLVLKEKVTKQLILSMFLIIIGIVIFYL